MHIKLMFCLALFSTAGFAADPRPLEIRLRDDYLVGAHRGGYFHADHNTISRFEHSIQLGVDIVEMDLRLSKDGVPVLFHNEELWPQTNCTGKVTDYTAADLKKCTLQFTNSKIPTFEEVLQAIQGRVIVDAEFKTREVIPATVALVQKYSAHDWTFFQTKEDPERYTAARSLDPNIVLLFAPNDLAALEWALGLNDPKLAVIEVTKDTSTPEFIARAKAAGKGVTEDVWHYSKIQEFTGAKCKPAFQKQINIAITNRPVSCLKQRNAIHSARKSMSLRSRLAGRTVGGHQGALFTFKQNTMDGFHRTMNYGADIIEMDLRLTKDGVPVVFHDPKLDTWTLCRGYVHDFTLAEIKTCRFRANKEEIPSFEEVLADIDGRVIVNAEFKEIEVIPSALQLVQKYNAHEWTYFQAQGDPKKYYEARRLDPNVALLFAAGNTKDLDWALGLNDPTLVLIEVTKDTRTHENIEAIHRAGKLVTEDAWHFHVDYEFFGPACDKAFNAGIDVAITNRPKGCVKQRDRFVSETEKAEGDAIKAKLLRL